MKILAIEKEIAHDSARYQPHLKAEAQHAWQLLQNDILREIYFTEETNEAVLILECASVEEAKAHLARLPLVKNELIKFEIMALKPYSGFARLFDAKSEQLSA